MNRNHIIAFVHRSDKIYLLGEGKDLEALCWYLTVNDIAFERPDINLLLKHSGMDGNNTGIILMMSDPEANKTKSLLEQRGFMNIYYVSAATLRDLRCMYSISTPNDRIEAEALLEAYQSGTLNKDIIGECTYAGLMYIKNFYDINTFQKIHEAVCETNLSEIRRKKRVVVGFLIKHSSEWSAEQLYRKMLMDEVYQPILLIAPYHVGTKAAIMDNYRQTVRYFDEKGYRYIAMYDEETKEYITWHKDIECDFIFNLTPNYIWLRKTSCIVKFPLSTLNIYIPYGYYISGLVESQFNQLSHMLFWKVFCESKLHLQMAQKYSDIGSSNVDFSGYLKMDTFYDTTSAADHSVWCIPGDCETRSMKRIIYAPHWSIGNSKTAYGSFEKNYKQMYKLAENTQEQISWIIKPHPRLRSECVVQGVFQTEEEYDLYLEMWDKLPNARAVTHGVYDDIFKTSDGMILDSISFLAEYMYVHKPMIFITRPEQTVNEFGHELMKVLYKADGNDFPAMQNMITDIILQENDYMKEERERFFNYYLDYGKLNGELATEHIMRVMEGN